MMMMSVDILRTNCDQCLSLVQCCFTSTETVRLIKTESTSTFTQLLNSDACARWWCTASCPRMSVDKLWPMPKHGSELLYVHRNHKVHWDGELMTATSTFIQLLNSDQMCAPAPVAWSAKNNSQKVMGVRYQSSVSLMYIKYVTIMMLVWGAHQKHCSNKSLESRMAG